MNLTRALIVSAGLLFGSAQACELKFGVVGDADAYSYEALPDFIRNEMRPRVKPGGDSERYGLQIQYVCDPDSEEKSLSAIFKIQPNTVYLKDLNELPLCIENQPKGRCDPKRYNYVDYAGGAPLVIDRESIIGALRVLSGTVHQSDLETTDPDRQAAIHNAVRLFAMLLAEATRFDYVLDDLSCTVSGGSELKFMDYWGLVHNWASIARAVSQGGEAAAQLKAEQTYQGPGILFVPITRSMVPYFDEFLPGVAGKPGWETTHDGKNMPVETREPSCVVQEEHATPDAVGLMSPGT